MAGDDLGGVECVISSCDAPAKVPPGFLCEEHLKPLDPLPRACCAAPWCRKFPREGQTLCEDCLRAAREDPNQRELGLR